MSLTKFWDVISRFVPGGPFLGVKPEELAKLNPDKFYVENVRAAMRTSTRRARFYCDTAVRQGVFYRLVEAIAPDDAVAITASSERELPPTVHRWVERNGEWTEETLETAILAKRIYYRLHR